MNADSPRNVLLYLKALIWSVFVSYTDDAAGDIRHVLLAGGMDAAGGGLRESHLGRGLAFLLERFGRAEDRELLAHSLALVKQSDPSLVYRNMVFEIGHYITAKEPLGGVPENCPGVIRSLKPGSVSALFLKPDGTLEACEVFPDQVMPVYTLTIPESST